MGYLSNRRKLNPTKLVKSDFEVLGNKKEGKISKILYQKIDKFRYVRNAVIHPRDPSFLNLGFKYTSYTGEGISSRGGGFVSPNSKPMTPLSLKEGAELGFRIYFHLRDELKIVE
ncbi:MAG: hypothetical protein JSW11_18255 [Candidatus Heimdallarchaeota archaeon]|nr:MAG: hypothetical protein JSW11_18255 [Candidatus Heimdallarchaeota archaeon]